MSAEQSSSLLSSVMSYFVGTVHAEEQVAKTEDKEEEPEAEEEEEAPAAAEEEEEEEPEDLAPGIRDECAKTKECAPAAKHFQHCSEKIEAGKGWEHEDCVEELFHLMHCVDTCAAPQIFKKLV